MYLFELNSTFNLYVYNLTYIYSVFIYSVKRVGYLLQSYILCYSVPLLKYIQQDTMALTQIKKIQVDGVNVLYREAGNPQNPVMLLLHGFPSSSFQYRNLITLLQDKFHVIAPDFPGFGFTEVPAERNYKYTFDGLADTLIQFVDKLGLQKYSMYIFDYGAPTGLRLALKYPERVHGVVSQNGNAYEEGLGGFWDTIRPLWKDPTQEIRANLKKGLLNMATTKFQYETGAEPSKLIAPEAYTLDQALLERPGNDDIQIDLFYDYRNNLPLYPKFQEFFRKHQPKVLAIWGKGDPIFIPPGAEAFKRDQPNAHVDLVEGSHFLLETQVEYVADKIKAVLL